MLNIPCAVAAVPSLFRLIGAEVHSVVREDNLAGCDTVARDSRNICAEISGVAIGLSGKRDDVAVESKPRTDSVVVLASGETVTVTGVESLAAKVASPA